MHNNPNDPLDIGPARLMGAVLLSVLVLVVFYLVFEKPYIDQKRQELAAQEKLAEDQGKAEDAAPANVPGVLDMFAGAKKDGDRKLDVIERDAAVAAVTRVDIDTPRLTGSISLRGARIDDLSLKGYYKTLDKKELVNLFSPAGTEHPFYAEAGWVAKGYEGPLPNSKTRWRVAPGGADTLTVETPVTLQWDNGEGLVFERRISVDEDYLFTVRQSVTNTTTGAVELYPYYLVSRNGLPENLQDWPVKHEGPLGFLADEVTEVDYKELMTEKPEVSFDTEGGWIGFAEQYWFAGYALRGEEKGSARFVHSKSDRPEGRFQTDFTMPGLKVEAGDTVEDAAYLFAGAKELDVLQRYEQDMEIRRFEMVIDFGMWYVITKPLMMLMNFLASVTGKFAIALLLLTVIVKLLMFPLNNKSLRSMAGMRKVQPKLLEIQEMYGHDREQLQKAILELYQKEQVNPMSGCWPMLLQIPVFFALYKVILIEIEMRHTPFWGWIEDMSVQDPTTIFNLFGLFDWTPPDMLMIGGWPVMLCLTMMWMHRFNAKPADPTQAMIIKAMPIMFTFLMARFAAGLVIYWTWNNLLTVFQQYFIMKRMGMHVSLLGVDQEAEARRNVYEEEEGEEGNAAEAEGEGKPAPQGNG